MTGVPAEVKGQVTERHIERFKRNADHYVALAANEVEKQTSLRMVLVRLHGASGRLILAGSEAEVEIGHRVALESLGEG